MRKGFTLVELVVVLGVFGILILAATDFLLQAMNNGTKATIENEVRQNANLILTEVANEIRASNCIYYTVSGNPGIVTVNISKGSVAGTCLDDGDGVAFVQDSTGVLTKTIYRDGTPTTARLNSNQVAVMNCNGNSRECRVGACTNGLVLYQVDGTTSLPQGVATGNGVGVSVWVQQSDLSASRPANCAIIKVADTIVPRRY